MYDVMRQFNVYLKTDLEMIYLGSTFATTIQEAKSVITAREHSSITEMQQKGIKYTIVAEANPCAPMFK